MKKFIFALGLIAVVGLSSYSYTQVEEPAKIETVSTLECKHGQCQGIAKSTGKRCKHCVSNQGDRYCYQHKG